MFAMKKPGSESKRRQTKYLKINEQKTLPRLSLNFVFPSLSFTFSNFCLSSRARVHYSFVVFIVVYRKRLINREIFSSALQTTTFGFFIIIFVLIWVLTIAIIFIHIRTSSSFGNPLLDNGITIEMLVNNSLVGTYKNK